MRDGTPVEQRRTRTRAARDLARFRLTQWIRAALVGLVLLGLVLAPVTLRPAPRALLGLTAGLTLVAVVAEAVVRRERVSAAVVTRVTVAMDAGYVCAGTFLTGGVTSPLTHGLLLHLAAIALLLGARTGAVLALSDAGLLVGIALLAGPATGARVPGAWQQLGVLLVVLAVVATSAGVLATMNRRELRRRRHDLDALTLLTERVERAARPAAVAQLLLDAVVSTYSLRSGVVVLVEDEGAAEELSLLATSAPGREHPRSGRSGQVQAAAAAGRTRPAPRPTPEGEPWLAALLPGAGPLLVVPLMADDRALGALVVDAGGSARHQRRILGGLQRSAAYGALALRNARLLESVQRLAVTDGLTRIANRRAFETALERELARATRAAEHVSLVMVDIDNFKELNDTLGHQAGDDVLRSAAAALAAESREFDTAARYGGEEFAVVLPGCGPELAHEIAERLRLAVCATGPVRVTASAGVATFPGHAGDAEGLVRAADEALYESKRSGRDRTTVAAGIEPEEQLAALVRRAVRGLSS